MYKTPDRPPILLFLLMFTGMLAVALGLAALSSPPGAATDGASFLGEHQVPVSAQHTAGTPRNAVHFNSQTQETSP